MNEQKLPLLNNNFLLELQLKLKSLTTLELQNFNLDPSRSSCFIQTENN